MDKNSCFLPAGLLTHGSTVNRAFPSIIRLPGSQTVTLGSLF